MVTGGLEKRSVTHRGKEYRFPALPVAVIAILNDGGLIPREESARADVGPRGQTLGGRSWGEVCLYLVQALRNA